MTTRGGVAYGPTDFYAPFLYLAIGLVKRSVSMASIGLFYCFSNKSGIFLHFVSEYTSLRGKLLLVLIFLTHRNGMREGKKMGK